MGRIIVAAAILFTFVVGLVGGYLWRKFWAQRHKDSVEAKIEKMIIEAKAKQKEILLAAQEKSLKVIEDSKFEGRQIRQELDSAKKRLEKRESLFDKKLLDLENQKSDLTDKAERISQTKEEIQKLKKSNWPSLKRSPA